MPSTFKKLRNVCQNLIPKFAVCQEGGSVLTTSTAGSIPRNRQQVANLRRHRETRGESHVKSSDSLFTVMLMCKESEGDKQERSFVRMVTGTPEPMMVLALIGL